MRGRNVNTSRQFTNFPPLHQARLTKHYKTLVVQEHFFWNKDELCLWGLQLDSLQLSAAACALTLRQYDWRAVACLPFAEERTCTIGEKVPNMLFEVEGEEQVAVLCRFGPGPAMMHNPDCQDPTWVK